MIKSLYVRVVLIFLGAVLVSLFLSFLLIIRLFEDRVVNYIQDEMIVSGKEIIESFIDTYPEHSEILVKGIAASTSTNFYGPDGKLLYEDVLTKKRIFVDAEAIQYVLDGGVYRSTGNGPHSFTVGIPFQINGQHFALINAPSMEPFMKVIMKFFKFELLFVLLFGSLFILIAAQYIVKPLQVLTRATRRMSKGEFQFELRSKRKDEIGQLTRSFNAMAKELGALETIRQRFVSNVSHEIQSPLTSIKGFTKALKQKKMDEEGRMRLLTIIEEETERLSRLGEDLLQLSSLEYEHLELTLITYRLDEQLRKAVISLEPQWAVRKQRIELDLEPFDMRADEDRVYRIWINLLSNAIKFTGVGGEIHISATRRGNSAVITIVDTGIGIPNSELDAIFQPFYKADPSRTGAAGGNGIGLSIVNRIVSLHHGDIQATSTTGVGTTFTVTLPLDQ